MTDHCHSLLFLIGYRGTGKTTVARLLAPRLGWDWVDADQALERSHGQSIREIFAQEGEAGFRAKESAVLEELAGQERLVVATGGGVILSEDNRTQLRRGAVVWLTAAAETLWKRLQRDATTGERRPNLAQGGLEEIEALMRQRTPWYAACADLIVDATREPEVVVEDILHWMEKVS